MTPLSGDPATDPPGPDTLAAGRRCFAEGRFAEAATLLQRFCDAHPHDPAAWCDLGSSLIAGGTPEPALVPLRRALDASPGFVPALINSGVALLKLDRWHEAAASLADAVDRAPNDPVACFNYGVALRRGGDAEGAVRRLEQARVLRPRHPETALELGLALQAAGRTDDAVASLRRAGQLRPGFFDASLALARLLHAERRFAEAADAFAAALAVDPAQAGLWNELGNAQQGMAAHAEAIGSFRRALAEQPGMAAAYCNMALSLAALDRHEEGILACRRAMAIEANGATPRLNLGFLMLALGRFREGWDGYEHRFAATGNGWFRAEVQAEPWLGEDLAGRSILVLGEQGYGDHLQFCRFLPALAAMGAAVTFLAPRRLHRLLGTLPAEITLVDALPARSRFDFQWPLMSLPLRFEQAGLPVPASTPYLAADPERVALWRERIGAEGFRVGIAWQGNAAGAVDIGRSFPLARMGALFGVAGVRLVSLQHGDAARQADALPEVERPGPEFDAGEDAFLDTAAVMEAVDLVITSDTSIAHLAGALGRPVWIALSSAPEWRWQRGRADSPWYPTARLFRQQAPGDWDGVFGAMAAALAALVRGTPAEAVPLPQVPISFGDLVDRRSILEIKAERFTGQALANVRRELEGLNAAGPPAATLPPAVGELGERLKRTNQTLWQLEDDIRALEAGQRFDGTFVEVARAIYFANDERGRIKRQINEITGSALVEEKNYRAY